MIILAIDRNEDLNPDVLFGLDFDICGLRFSIGICKPWRREQIYSYAVYAGHVTPFHKGFYTSTLAGCIRTTIQWG